ncbi:MAG: phytanoyl-CoA dioxygenase family protein [Arenicellales bacterium]|jgi:hypothetical protein|nr:phytanoyl-CoA dioxygenase family protein [Arenicellales bacterium]
MPHLLTEDQVASFERDGFLSPIQVISPEEAQRYRNCLEIFETSTGELIGSDLRHNVHLLFTWADELLRCKKILDAVEDVLGPNLLCWTTNFFIKEPREPSFVSWHQDSTYWGLEPTDIVSAWVALSDTSMDSGAMRMLPGSHLWEQQPHYDTFHEHNLLSRGQELVSFPQIQPTIGTPLQPGEMSLHHGRLAHASDPNQTDDRRIGFVIRYIAPHVRQTKVKIDGAVLVRGVDDYGHFAADPPPQTDLDDVARFNHRQATDRLLGALMDGTDAEHFRA